MRIIYIPKKISLLFCNLFIQKSFLVLLFLVFATFGFSQNEKKESIIEKLFDKSFPEKGIGLNPEEIQKVAGIQYDTSYVGQKLRKKGQKLIMFGYARMFGYGRNMTEAYPNLSPYEKAYGFGDGYREPMLSLNIFGRPNGKSAFGTELFIFTPFIGNAPQDNTFSVNLGINFYGNFRTQHGSFGIRVGGIHWYYLSSFTVGVYQILERFSIFDRTPWEAANNIEKYDSYYTTGASDAGDLRWNNQAFQGLILNGSNLPLELNFDFFWGKTQPNGGLINANTRLYDPNIINAGTVPTYQGFAGDGRYINNFITGGKLGRSFGNKKNALYYNVIFSQTALDSLNNNKRQYQVHSLSYDIELAKIKFVGELAFGSYHSPNFSKKWGEALMMHAFLPKDYTFLPIDVQLYQISKKFFNQNSAIATNSNPDILNDFGLTAGATGVGAQLALVGQLVHNRRGINVNSSAKIGDLKLSAGWGISQEIDVASTQITYVHRINGLALSRVYNPFPEGATSPTIFGPYGRKISFFRGVSEITPTLDVNPIDGSARNKKYFGSVDLQAKYKFKVKEKPVYLFYLGSFGNASSQLNGIPLYNQNTYLFVQYHEFDAYLEIFSKFILTAYLGFENARGGKYTVWDEESNLPLDQFGTGIGLGFDWTIAKNTGLYFRHRWMEFEDKNFALDKFKGREVTIELKTFF